MSLQTARLYAVEREAQSLINGEGLTTEGAWQDWHRRRYQLRQEQSLPALSEFHDWLQEVQWQVLPKSPVGRAQSSMRCPVGTA
jgi:hypothetical protein